MAGSSRYVRLVPCAVPGCSSVPTVLDSAAVSAAPSSSPNSLPRGSPAREEERRGSEARFRFSRWATFTWARDSVVRESRRILRGCQDVAVGWDRFPSVFPRRKRERRISFGGSFSVKCVPPSQGPRQRGDGRVSPPAP